MRLGSAVYSTLARPLSGNPALRLQWALGAAVGEARAASDPLAEGAAWDEALVAAADVLGAYSLEWGQLLAACAQHYAQRQRAQAEHIAALAQQLAATEAALRAAVAAGHHRAAGGGGGGEAGGEQGGGGDEGGGGGELDGAAEWLGYAGTGAGAAHGALAAAEREHALQRELLQLRRSLAKVGEGSVSTMSMAQRVKALRGTLLELGGTELAAMAADLLGRCTEAGRLQACQALPAAEQRALVADLARGWGDEEAAGAIGALVSARADAGRRACVRQLARETLSDGERAFGARECVRATEGGARVRLLVELCEGEAAGEADRRELLTELLRGPCCAGLGRGARRELLASLLDALPADEAAGALALELRGRLDQPRLLTAAASLLCAPATSATAGAAQLLADGRPVPQPAAFAALLVQRCGLGAAQVADVCARALREASGPSDERLRAAVARALHGLAGPADEAPTTGGGEGVERPGAGARARERVARLVLAVLSRAPSGELLPPAAPARPPPPRAAAPAAAPAAAGGEGADGAAAAAGSAPAAAGTRPMAPAPAPPPPPPPQDGASALLRAAEALGPLADAQPAALVAALFSVRRTHPDRAAAARACLAAPLCTRLARTPAAGQSLVPTPS